MAIEVSKKGVKVKAGGKYHSFGDTINGLPELEEERMMEEGVCVRVPSSIASPVKSKATGSKKKNEDAEQVDNADDSDENGPDTSHPSA